jgi:hypothetical protein
LAANHLAKVKSIPFYQDYLGTLLNLLFETKFDVMDGDKGRTQTTKGIWMAINAASNILVFDIEGTDSKERGE